ncbi:hypothetical protein AYO21_08687 [Fonsecaea monophora]|uniref:Uncharacterized protein n=1 Tax=Fonsecaea monophora TaxID=254056 RepID=A0A177F1G5_9EURO|nr:hypothetical protein AYO21_08687 [Fonsecaea monophora]OAG37152.1 hypothetical protein AYO21_08687 [Fonsecaea monophora]
MILPHSYWVHVSQFSPDTLPKRAPQSPNTPGFQESTNGTLEPEGSQQEHPNFATAVVTEGRGTTTGDILPIETRAVGDLTDGKDLFARQDIPSLVSSAIGSELFPPPFPFTPGIPPFPTAPEASFLTAVTSTPDPGSTLSSTSSPSTTLTDNLSSRTLGESTTTSVNPGGLLSQTSTASDPLSAARTASQSSTPNQSFPMTSAPARTTASSSLQHTASAPAVEASMNGTTESKCHGTLSQGQKAGIAIGTLVGATLILSLLYWFFRWRKGGRQGSIVRLGRHRHPESGETPWPRNQPFGILPDSPMAEAGSSNVPAWNHENTHAQPTMIVKARQSMPRSLRFLRTNPLGMNPITPPASRPRTPSRKSLASSLFRRRSTASTLRSVSVPPTEEQPVSMRGPHSLRPLFIPPFRLHPAASPASPSKTATKSVSASTRSFAGASATHSRPMSQQQRPRYASTSPADRDPRSARAIFDRTRPRLPSKLSRSQSSTTNTTGSESLPQGVRKDVPPPVPLWRGRVMSRQPLPTLSTLWERDKTLQAPNLSRDGHLDVLKANTKVRVRAAPSDDSDEDEDEDDEEDTPPLPPPKSPRMMPPRPIG